MTQAEDKQVGQYRNTQRFLTAVLVPAALVLAQPQAQFQLPVQQLNGSALLVVLAAR